MQRTKGRVLGLLGNFRAKPTSRDSSSRDSFVADPVVQTAWDIFVIHEAARPSLGL